jgi:sulfur carrier protein
MNLRVTVNDEPHELPAAATVATLLDHLDLGDRRIAVELNGEIVPRSRYDQTPLSDEDVLLVVQAIGGG